MNIVVINHEKTIADYLVLLLSEFGCRALPLYTTQDAIDHFRKIQFDLAIISNVMPVMSGDELGDLYRTELFQQNCKVILVGTDPTLTDSRLQSPEFRYLTLPFEKEDLRRMIYEA